MSRDLIKEALTAHWGERCPDFDPDCPCCQAWAEFAALEAEASEGEPIAWLTEWRYHKANLSLNALAGGSSITRDAKDAADKLEFYRTWDCVEWVRQTPLYAALIPAPARERE